MSIWWSESKNESSLAIMFLTEFLHLSWIRQKSNVEKHWGVHGGAKYGVVGFLYVKSSLSGCCIHVLAITSECFSQNSTR